MTDPMPDPLVAILRLCAAAAPQPWYPREYVRVTGMPRESLEPHLERVAVCEPAVSLKPAKKLFAALVLTPEISVSFNTNE